MALEHGRARYQRGCRCNVCKAAEAAHKRRWRASKRAAEIPDEIAEGPVCAGVRGELASTADTRPGRFALALSMALVLDNAPPRLHPPASRVLTRILDRAAAESKPAPSRLAALRALTDRNTTP